MNVNKMGKIVWLVLIFLTNIIFLLDINASDRLLIFLNVILILCTVFYNRFSAISLTSLFFNMLWVAILIQKNTGVSYGLLQADLFPLNGNKILNCSFIFNDVLSVCSILLNINEHEKNILQYIDELQTVKPFIYFCNFVAIVFTVVAFPRLSLNITGSERFDMLLPGNAWNQLAVVGLIFNLKYLKKYTSVQLTYLFCIFWFLANGERVDMTGLFLGMLIYFFNVSKKVKFETLLKGASILIFMTLVMLSVGNNRIGSSFSDLRGIFTFSTVSDVAYLLNITIDYINKFSLFNGQIILSNLYNLIPFMEPKVDFSSVMSSVYPFPGGEPIISAGLLDFGVKGIIFTTVIDNLFLRFILNFKCRFWGYEYLLILCSIPRIVWYGRSYVFSGLIFFIPIMLIIEFFFNKAFVKYK